MTQSMSLITVISVIILIALVLLVIPKGSSDEEYSYHFGFPTWGAINNSPWATGWGGVRLNPFMWPYGGYYYQTSIAPYLTNKCYSSSEEASCVPGYRKIGTDTDDDGAKDKWQCCRRWR